MTYVTHRTLKSSMSKVIPKSGHVKVSLQVEDEQWMDRFQKWDKMSRTFTEVSFSNRIFLTKLMQLEKVNMIKLY